MTSHKKSGSCCRRHSRQSRSAAVTAKKDNTQVKAVSRSGKPEEKRPFTLPLKRKPNGVWSYRFGGAFKKLMQSSLSDYRKDPEDLILKRLGG